MTQPGDSGTRVGNVRVPWLLPLLMVLSVVAFVDEWTFIVSRRPWDLGLIFVPQNATWLQTVEVFRGAPDMTPHGYIENDDMPTLQASDYLAATAALGSAAPLTSLDELWLLPPERSSA